MKSPVHQADMYERSYQGSLWWTGYTDSFWYREYIPRWTPKTSSKYYVVTSSVDIAEYTRGWRRGIYNRDDVQ